MMQAWCKRENSAGSHIKIAAGMLRCWGWGGQTINPHFPVGSVFSQDGAIPPVHHPNVHYCLERQWRIITRDINILTSGLSCLPVNHSMSKYMFQYISIMATIWKTQVACCWFMLAINRLPQLCSSCRSGCERKRNIISRLLNSVQPTGGGKKETKACLKASW